MPHDPRPCGSVVRCSGFSARVRSKNRPHPTSAHTGSERDGTRNWTGWDCPILKRIARPAPAAISDIPSLFYFVFLISTAAVAVIQAGAIVLVMSLTDSVWAIIAAGLICILLILPTRWFVMSILGRLWKYSRCPACGARRLVFTWMVRSNPPLPTFYLCRACGARFSKILKGPWQHASDPQFDDKYQANYVRGRRTLVSTQSEFP